MKITSLFLLLLVIFLYFYSYQSHTAIAPTTKDFPKCVKLTNLQQTKFAPVLESPIDRVNNYIYGATLAYAWDTITKILPAPITQLTSTTLQTIHDSKSYQGVLDPSDIQVDVMVNPTQIVSEASFQKTLDFVHPFKTPEDFDYLYFKKEEKIASFGCKNNHVSFQPNYFYSNNDFAVQLLSKDTTQEIHLIQMPLEGIPNIKTMVDLFLEKSLDSNKAKSLYPDSLEESLRVPLIAFNIEHNYSTIEGSRVTTSQEGYAITTCYQQNAFMMNERGAKVKSAATIVMSRGVPRNITRDFHFNNSYLIMLRKKGKVYPYFAVLVNNTELLEEYKEKPPSESESSPSPLFNFE